MSRFLILLFCHPFRLPFAPFFPTLSTSFLSLWNSIWFCSCPSGLSISASSLHPSSELAHPWQCSSVGFSRWGFVLAERTVVGIWLPLGRNNSCSVHLDCCVSVFPSSDVYLRMVYIRNPPVGTFLYEHKAGHSCSDLVPESACAKLHDRGLLSAGWTSWFQSDVTLTEGLLLFPRGLTECSHLSNVRGSSRTLPQRPCFFTENYSGTRVHFFLKLPIWILCSYVLYAVLSLSGHRGASFK